MSLGSISDAAAIKMLPKGCPAMVLGLVVFGRMRKGLPLININKRQPL